MAIFADAPAVMPSDFSVQYHYDGGMRNVNRTIHITVTGGSDEGRPDQGKDYKHAWTKPSTADLTKLYSALRKISAFTLQSSDKGHVHDRGGESITYVLNGKTFSVSDAQSNFILAKDRAAFEESIKLILEYTAKASGRPFHAHP